MHNEIYSAAVRETQEAWEEYLTKADRPVVEAVRDAAENVLAGRQGMKWAPVRRASLPKRHDPMPLLWLALLLFLIGVIALAAWGVGVIR